MAPATSIVLGIILDGSAGLARSSAALTRNAPVARDVLQGFPYRAGCRPIRCCMP